MPTSMLSYRIPVFIGLDMLAGMRWRVLLMLLLLLLFLLHLPPASIVVVLRHCVMSRSRP